MTADQALRAMAAAMPEAKEIALIRYMPGHPNYRVRVIFDDASDYFTAFGDTVGEAIVRAMEAYSERNVKLDEVAHA